MKLFAVHHVFDCLDYNEHHYFNNYIDAWDLFSDIVSALKQEGRIDEVFTDLGDEFYVQLSDGLEKVYIQTIDL